MEYVFKDKITFKQYEEFMKNQKYLSFMQEEMWAKVKGINKHKVVGILKNNKVCALAHILIKRKKGKNILIIPNGFVMDYSNKELLNIMTENIKKIGKTYNAYVVNVYPNIIIDSNEHTLIQKNLTDLGYEYNDNYLENTTSILIPLKENNKKINKNQLKEKYENKDFYLKRGIYFEISDNLEDIKRLDNLINRKYFNNELVARLLTNYPGRIKFIFARLDLVFYSNYLKENNKELDEISKIEELLTISEDIDIGCALIIEPYNKKESVCELIYNTEKESFEKLEITNGILYEAMKICIEKNYNYIKITNINLDTISYIQKYNAIKLENSGCYNLVLKKLTYFFNKELCTKKR